tara:strand:- start:113 stop:616 length:504 start_codon:yes stop_codon:yes gene_type:complete
MKIKLSTDFKTKVWEWVSKHQVGKRGKADGSKEEAYTGLLGELAVHKLFKKDVQFSEGFDGGFDFEYNGLKIDVKTMGRSVDPKPDYVNNFIEYQKDFKCDAYIFCSLNKKTSELTICGWITKTDMLHKAKRFDEGTIRQRNDGTTFKLKAPTYELKNYYLKPIQTL